MTNDPLEEGICIKCHENGYNCKCDQFHPTIKKLDLTCQSCNEEIKVGETCNVYHERCDNYLKLSFYDALELKQYFYKRAGWMSPDLDKELLRVISIVETYIDKLTRNY